VRALDLIPPPGCSLSLSELADQRGRARRLAPAAVGVARDADTLQVTFGDGVDEALLRELIATERSCCSFLAIDYDRPERRLSVAASDAQGREVVSRFYAFFAESAR
jgi:hypothetical protein